MAYIGFTINVNQPDVVSQYFDRIRVFRSTTGIGGTYTEITSPATRLAIESDRSKYDFYDLTGADDYYYQVDYINSTSGEVSSRGAPIRATPPPSSKVLTPTELRNLHFHGISFQDGQGNEMPDSTIQHFIEAAIAHTERLIDIPIRRKVSSDVTPGADDGSYGGDYIRSEWRNYYYAKLPEAPIISVESAQLVFPGSDTPAFDFPLDWLRLEKQSGDMYIVPGSGATALGSAGILYNGSMPYVFGRTGIIPGIYRISYTCGFDPVPADVKELVALQAGVSIFDQLGDLILGAGIATTSLSMDGLSQSVGTTSSATNSGYGARTGAYKKRIKEMTEALKSYYKPVRLVVA